MAGRAHFPVPERAAVKDGEAATSRDEDVAPPAAPALRQLPVQRDDTAAVGLVFSADMEAHAGPASHPECPQRHAAIVTRLQEEGLVDSCKLLVPTTVTREQALRAHSAAHLDDLARLYDSDGPAVQGKGDLFWNSKTDAAARLSAGCAVAATLAVGRGEVDSAFAIIRPPGHHAECDRTSALTLTTIPAAAF